MLETEDYQVMVINYLWIVPNTYHVLFQGLTCSSLVSEELLETVLSEIEGCNHLISVQLVCLLRTNPDRFAQVLFDTFPKLAAQIVKDFASAKNLSLVSTTSNGGSA